MSGGGGGSTTQNNIPGELKPLASLYAQKAIGIADNPYRAYTGNRFAGLSDAQGDAGDFYKSGIQSGTNPYLDQMVGRAQGNLIDNYKNSILPGMDAVRARSGSFGNTGVEAAADRGNDMLMRNLSDISTQMYGGQYNADQNRRMESASGLMNFGALQQAANQQPLDFAYQQFQEAQNQPYKNLAAMGAPFGANMGSTQTTSTKSDPMQQLLGLGLLGLGGGLFSDKRLKTDIKRVGKTDDGESIYTYKYKGDDTTQMGVMAQELLKTKPHAVKNIAGLLAVDYSKV